MPKPKEGESQKDFVKRCIPIVLNDGSAKDNQQAVAMCYSMYREGRKSMSTKHGGTFSPKQMDHLQAIHNHSHDLGATHPGEEPDGDEAKHGNFSISQKADKIQAMHDHSVDLGAGCASDMDGAEEKAVKAVKFMMDSGMGEDAEDYAREELGDIMTAAYALIQLAQLTNEMDEADDASEVANLMRGILEFISGEIDEMEQAASAEKRHSFKVSSRSDVDKADRERAKEKYGDVKFADEKNKKYPIDTEEHIRAAWNYINKENNAGKYSSSEVETIKNNIVRAWKEKIDKAGPPSADKSLDLSYIKSLGLVIPTRDFAVKYVGRDEIWHRPFLWGDVKKFDIEKEYFTKSTNFWDEQLGKSPRPLTWDHAQDDSFKADPLIGQTVEWGDDDLGRWAVSKLDRSHKYRKMIDQLIDEGILGTSSDSAPQYVERERTGKSTWLKTWPWFASALTDVPCEPRMIGSVEVLKSLGVTLPDALSDEARLREKALRLKAFAIKQK